jgi:hypothetical protein
MATELTAESDRRITIVVRPGESDDALLSVEDALQQVLDFLRLAQDAKASLENLDVDFEWKLEWASTNSPFTLRAIAEPLGGKSDKDISASVEAVKARSAKLIRDCAAGLPVPAWVASTEALYSLFERNAKNLSRTMIEFDGAVGSVEIDRASAEKAFEVFEDIPLAAFQEVNIPRRQAYGEIDGRMVMAGRFFNKPAFQLQTILYGLVWCLVSPEFVQRLGTAHSLAEVWDGKRLVVYGRITYSKGGKRVSRIEVQSLREKTAPQIKIEDVLDADFTAGLDPVEYLNRLHGGELG